MSSTRQTTPVVPPPERTVGTADAVRKRPLKAPIAVVSGEREWSHESGSLTIGRDSQTDLCLDDPLVSRIHARLLVQSDGHVLLEDLHSSNGVFVNGSKLSRPSVQLCEGDSLLFGTSEFSVFSLRASATVPVSHRLDTPGALVKSPPKDCAASAVPVGSMIAGRGAVTGRHDAIDMVGGLAEQLEVGGHRMEAERVLSEHLHSLLKGASVGLTVPERILESATRFALRLHAWTQRSAWVDYVFELHVACQRVPSDTSLRALESACNSAQGMDRDLVRYLVKSVESTIDTSKADQVERLQRLRRLAR